MQPAADHRPEFRATDELPAFAGKTAEFRKALEDEIEAARKSSSSNGVPLSDGRRIAKVGSQFQYTFTMESALDAPGDAPADLVVSGGAPLKVIILSVEGLRVTLSVPVDLGGFVPLAKLVTDLTFLLRRLIERIEGYADRPNPAGDRVLGEASPFGGPLDANLDPKLNPEQRKAILRCLGSDVTFLWGPPGTGKTWTIGNLGAELYRRDRPVLLVSHTNTAVDGALLKVAEALDDCFVQGQVLRVGQPKDLRLAARPELLLETEVERRSADMKRQLEALRQEREKARARVLEIQRLLDLLEWVTVARVDLDAAAGELQALHDVEHAAAQASQRLQRLEADAARWRVVHAEAVAAEEDGRRRLRCEARIADLQPSRRRLQERQAALEPEVEEARRQNALAQEAAPLRARAAILPTLAAQESLVLQSRAAWEKAQNASGAAKGLLAEAEAVYTETTSVGFLTRRWRRLPPPDVQAELVETLRAEATAAAKTEAATLTDLERDRTILQEIQDIHERMKPFEYVPELDKAARVLRDLERQTAETTRQLASVEEDLARVLREFDAALERLKNFRAKHGAEPGEVLRQAGEYEEALQSAETEAASLRREAATKRARLEEVLGGRLLFVRELGYSDEPAGTAETMLVALEVAHRAAAKDVEGIEAEPLVEERDALNQRLRAIEGETAALEEALKRVEEIVIAEAKVIATTLTTAYLRDAILARRFDTVVLDEASMAPIPALWVAAGLADRAAVVVGDFLQLPPIVQAKTDLAEKWLGRDVFEAAGIVEAWREGKPPEHFVALREQFRMHPAISAVPNTLVYHGLLVDADEAKRDGDLFDWYDRDWGHNTPVLLVDTASINAWVTSVSRGATSSRVNFLSATVCADLAAMMLKPDRPEPDAMRHRTLAIAPYRPHAQLLRLLLKDLGLQDEVLAGTTHQFQGQEAEVVIFDLVNDEPHWKVGLFNPKNDEQNRRLLNVALTRARRRLIVVGDFDYNRSTGKNAFLGRDLLPFLLSKYPRIDVLDVLPAGLAARAARAAARTMGEGVETGGLGFAVTQEDYFRLLVKDIAKARSRIVIYSPFMTQQRLGMLQVHLQAARERGVRIYVITKPLQERDTSERARCRDLERTLERWGVAVIHKMRMHEKVVIIDDDILWEGSLNTLSHRDTQEIMERRQNREVVAHYIRVLCLDDLLRAKDEAEDRCSVCNSEVVADEGRDEPFYWHCVEGCFTRSIGRPFPRNEVPTCQKCEVPLDLVERDGDYEWRCPRDGRHRRAFRAVHARFPNVRAHIPLDILRVLDARFGAARPQQQFLFGPDDEDLWALAEGPTADDEGFEEEPENGSTLDEQPAEE